MKSHRIGWLAVFVIITTLLWIVLLVISESGAPEIKSIQDKIQVIENQKSLYIAGYLNAALLTLFAVFFMSAVFAHFRKIDSFWSTIAFSFIPIYGLANLISYLSQVFILPTLISLFKENETQAVALVLLKLSIHTWPGSAIEALNSLAYAILGIPSIIFSLIFFRSTKILKLGGLLLLPSGVLSILAFVGLITGLVFLTSLSILSGIIFYCLYFQSHTIFFQPDRFIQHSISNNSIHRTLFAPVMQALCLQGE